MGAIRAVVWGRVQGVGFRYYVSRVAQELGVDGEVWNRRDGGVEVIAGPEDPQARQEFLQRLKEGPGRVEAVDVQPWAGEVRRGFRVGLTR